VGLGALGRSRLTTARSPMVSAVFFFFHEDAGKSHCGPSGRGVVGFSSSRSLACLLER